MGALTLVTFDWVSEMPRGYVHDIRVRWALEEAALPYRIESTHLAIAMPSSCTNLLAECRR